MDSLRFVEVPHGGPAYRETVELRDAILRKPLGLSFSSQELAEELDSHHLAVVSAERTIGCLVLKPLGAQRVQMRQVAVHPAWQRRGVGSSLVRFCERFARRCGYVEMMAHARETAVAFYEKLGYERRGEGFEEVGLPHFVVVKRLD